MNTSPATHSASKQSSARGRITGLWWKVPLASLAILLLLAVFAHALWSRLERNRVEQRLIALRAAHLPTVAKDLDAAPVPDDQNVVVPIRAAAAALDKDEDRRQRRDEATRDDPNAFALPLTPGEVALLRDDVAANADALTALAAAQGRHAVDWGTNSTNTPMITRALPSLNDLRQLARRLVDVAKLAAADGEAAECGAAIGRLRSLEEAAVGTESLVGTLVRIGIAALGADAIIDVAPDVALNDDAARTAARSMIAELLADGPRVDADVRRGLLAERIFGREMLAQMRAGNLGGVGVTSTASTGVQAFVGALAAPTLYRSEWKILDYMAEQIRLCDAPDLAAYAAGSAEATRIADDLRGSRLTMLGAVMLPALERYHATRYRVIVDERLAATALAIRLYQLGHAGDRPATLDALVPTYLPAVPIDAIDGHPLRYDPTRAILWSVGENQIDDGGDATQKHPDLGRSRWAMKDAVVFLARQPRPATVPSE